MSQAGADSPHLDTRQRKQAAERTPPGPLVIHEIVREQGKIELERPFSGLAWSGLAAGLSIGFSFLAQAYLHAGLADAPWRRLVTGFGYSVGFLIVILGRQQLFTETTLTALIPTLTRPSLANLLGTLRVWAIVLPTNLIGTLVFAAIAARPGVFQPEALAAMEELSAHLLAQPFWQVVITGGSAGWLIGLMVWLLPASGAARPLIIILLTYVIALCQFPHIIAGSAEAAFGVFAGHASVGDYLFRFLLPVLIGNAFGGTALAALLNHAQVAEELKETGPEEQDRPASGAGRR
ncbi:MAG: formate/nitrite transporter family protein [Acetobacteraceae bacterium]|nr:formate/nitrite transporter family protein [Acetobacteraceae bacterium]